MCYNLELVMAHDVYHVTAHVLHVPTNKENYDRSSAYDVTTTTLSRHKIHLEVRSPYDDGLDTSSYGTAREYSKSSCLGTRSFGWSFHSSRTSVYPSYLKRRTQKSTISSISSATSPSRYWQSNSHSLRLGATKTHQAICSTHTKAY